MGLFRNALRCRKTGACRILVPLRYIFFFLHKMMHDIINYSTIVCTYKVHALPDGWYKWTQTHIHRHIHTQTQTQTQTHTHTHTHFLNTMAGGGGGFRHQGDFTQNLISDHGPTYTWTFIYALMNSCTCHCQKCHKSISDMLSLFDLHDRHRQLAGRGIWT